MADQVASLEVELKATLEEFKAQLKEAHEELKKFHAANMQASKKSEAALDGISESVGKLSKAFSFLKITAAAAIGTFVGQALGVAIGRIGEMVIGADDLARAIGKSAEAAGLTTTQYQTLAGAAELLGVHGEKLDEGLKQFNRSLAQIRKGVGGLYEELTRTNPALVAQLRSAKSVNEALGYYTDHIATIPPGVERAFFSARSANRGLEILNELAGETPGRLEEIRQKLGFLVIPKETIEQAKNLQGEWDLLGLTIERSFTRGFLNMQTGSHRAAANVDLAIERMRTLSTLTEGLGSIVGWVWDLWKDFLDFLLEGIGMVIRLVQTLSILSEQGMTTTPIKDFAAAWKKAGEAIPVEDLKQLDDVLKEDAAAMDQLSQATNEANSRFQTMRTALSGLTANRFLLQSQLSDVGSGRESAATREERLRVRINQAISEQVRIQGLSDAQWQDLIDKTEREIILQENLNNKIADAQELYRHNLQLQTMSEQQALLRRQLTGADDVRESAITRALIIQNRVRQETVGMTDAMAAATEQAIIMEERLKNALEDRARVMEKVRSFTEVLGSSLSSAFDEFLENGKVEWKAWADTIVKELLRVAMQVLILKPLVDSLTSALGGGIFGAFGGGGFSGLTSNAATGLTAEELASVVAYIHHKGGVVGFGGEKRWVHPTVFDGAPRMHRGGIAGLRSNEVPAILEKGERVVPRGGDGGVTVNVINKAPGVEAREGPERQGPGGVRIKDIIVEEVNRAVTGGDLDQSFGARFGVARRTAVR